MAQLLQFPNAAIAEQNKAAAESVFPGDYMPSLTRDAAKILAIKWAMIFSESWRSGKLIFSDDAHLVMNEFINLSAETQKLMEEK